MSGNCFSTIVNAMKFKDEVLITSSKNLIAIILLTASSLAFIQRHGKIRASLRSLAAKIFKYQDQGATTTTEKLEEEGGLELDCVVCLSQVSQGDNYKILPTCKHGFHVNCIDAWLQRHSTCPLCRCPVPRTPIQYCSISTQDPDFDALISYILRLLDHVRTWLMDPLNALSEDCLRFP
ncbi:E3 ubiquitin-protein ligase EL5-like [Olea europaea var. sylvestris]|uniref:E3 ubiquitin-protein ligase EL5-like n=1 Tax=Olea europaea var. sylvestris TaxID=158386 RepID=UPI000C1CE094|nr:E3 ubiquitin-protein ligase EL5-like [Olea europaea var. sylvestris]